MALAVVWATLWATLTLLILLHELGHALAARALGLRVNRVIVGVGPRWLGLPFMVCGIPFSVRPLPVGGGAYIDERGAATWRRSLVVAAGPAASVAAGLALLWAGMGVAGLRLGVSMLARLPGALAEALWRAVLRVPQPAVHAVGGAAPVSVAGVLVVAGFLSVVLGVGNLLPFAPLDGGRLLGLALLALRVPRRVREAVACAGLAGVLLAMAPSCPGGWPVEFAALGGAVLAGRLLRRALPPSWVGWLERQCGVGGGGAPGGDVTAAAPGGA